ncbi:MAG: hydrogenase nickel incorporation protein HypB [Desulfatirhabdiaceae bacterium]
MEIKIVKKVLDANLTVAEQNRKLFRDNRVFVINVMSSPGSGKTTLLEKTLTKLSSEIRAGIIVGDVSTTHDAERLARSGAPVVQVNTDEFGGDCHLAAHVIAKALENFDVKQLDLLIIENVGNLVCPAEFDIGEDVKAVVLSVTEGEDKPVKYPLMFRVCDVAVLNKIDLLPHLDYDRQAAVNYIHQVNSGMPIFELSAKTEAGMVAWLNYIREKTKQKNEMI